MWLIEVYQRGARIWLARGERFDSRYQAELFAQEHKGLARIGRRGWRIAKGEAR